VLRKRLLPAWLILVLLVAVGVGVAGCTPAAEAPPEEEEEEEEAPEAPEAAGEVLMGLISPLSGSIAYYGQLMREGARLAVQEINQAGGVNIGGKPYSIKLIVEDDRALPADSVSAAEKLIHDNGVHMIVGSFTSTATLANLEVSKRANIVQITPVAVADAVCPASPWMFRNVPNQTMQTSFNANWVRDNLDIKKAGIIASDDDYGRGGADIWAKIMTEDGVEVLKPEFFQIGDTEFSSQLTKLRAQGVDTIFLVALITEGSQIVTQAQEIGMDVQFIGLGGFASDRFLELAGEAAEGMVHVSYWEPDPANPASMHYRDAFVEFSGLEAEMFGAAAYDAVYILKTAMETVGEPPSQDLAYQEKLREAMLDIEFTGAQGSMHFNEDGQAQIGLYLVRVEGGKRVILGRWDP
jgi:branched-chain amino acid transport system substrate-binding protein